MGQVKELAAVIDHRERRGKGADGACWSARPRPTLVSVSKGMGMERACDDERTVRVGMGRGGKRTS